MEAYAVDMQASVDLVGDFMPLHATPSLWLYYAPSLTLGV